CRPQPGELGRQSLIVFGVDGMDPSFLERHWAALPALRKLRDTGGFRRLQTTTPPQSPVAWSTFITGLDPDGHGIYDFVHRDPNTLAPFSSMNRLEPPRWQLPFGPWIFPLSSARVISLRNGVAFWSLLANQGVPVFTSRMPTNFPPVESGEAISGMGVPDLRGGFGTFTLYTDEPEEIARSVPGGEITTVAVGGNGRVLLPLQGPSNPLRKDQQTTVATLITDVDANANAIQLSVGEEVVILQAREWSEWIPVEFSLVPWIASTKGMVRVYAKSVTPLRLYVSPINIDPSEPAIPISAPAALAAKIARETGPFYTQGIAQDTAAVRHGALSLEEYKVQSRMVFEDEKRLLRQAIRAFREGFLFVYFSSVDQDSHMLWERDETALLETYRRVDEAIWETMQAVPTATFVVMSDHGFARFERSFQLNAWLVQERFLVLDGPPGGDGFQNVDWSRTQAYALGLNGLYLNMRGREAKGIVENGDRLATLDRIKKRLLEARDPDTGERIVQAVAQRRESAVAPDLILGYSPGYRAAWNTGLGASEGKVVEENQDPWIGDHCIDPVAVPGVLLSSKPIKNEQPALRDLPPSILRFFNVSPPAAMTGRNVF
ncbi:MAG TPA: alkaline phosphatase family protein, partial [Bryobacteraceae bacterium]|nr:alkaline phosphatase family protein [Bryobacteraceae bacterium]